MVAKLAVKRYMYRMQFDRQKFKEAIVYIASHCEPDRLGAVKLNKVLYFSDMLNYASSGEAITWAEYKKRPMGPTSDYVPRALRELEKESRLKISEVNYFGYLKKQYEPISKPDLSRFREKEIALIDEVIDFVCNKNSATTISDYSHNAAWDSVSFGDPITYNSVFHIFDNVVSEEDLDWADSQAAVIEDARSNNTPLVTAPFGDLRSRVLAVRG